MGAGLLPIEERELIALLDEGLAAGADAVYFRAGCAALGTGHGGRPRRLGTRQLAEDDLMAITEILLRRCYVPEALDADPCDAAHELGMLCELRDRALVIPHMARDEHGLLLVLELARPIRTAEDWREA